MSNFHRGGNPKQTLRIGKYRNLTKLKTEYTVEMTKDLEIFCNIDVIKELEGLLNEEGKTMYKDEI